MRRRELSPDFFHDDKIGTLPPLARLFYQGLWCVADREGRLVYEPRVLWAKVLPYDTWEPSVVEALEEARRVLPYGLNGTRYAWLPNLKKHQHFHPNEQPSKLPRHPDDASEEYQRITKVLHKDHQGTPSAPAKDHQGDPEYRTCRALPSLPSLPSGSSLPSGPSGSSGEGKDQIPSTDPDAGLTDAETKAKDAAIVAELDRQAAQREAKQPAIPYDDIVAAYNENLPTLPRCRRLSATSRTRAAIAARWREDPERQSVEWWRSYFASVAEMPFLIGRGGARDGGAPFRASLLWLVLPTNLEKVTGGFYQKAGEQVAPPPMPEGPTLMEKLAALEAENAARRRAREEEARLNPPKEDEWI